MFSDVKEAIDWVHSVSTNRKEPPKKDNLDRIQEMLSLLGHPEWQLPPIVHVTGTNGKSSTSKFIQTILTDAGYKTGLFVSPHIVEFQERIEVDGQNIDDENLIAAAQLVKDVYTNQTEFEVILAIAVLYFKDQNLDAIVLEVGIGGLFDSTNVLDGDVVVITSVDLDHTEMLGDTLEKIALQKSGIIKQKTKAVLVGKLDPEARLIIETQARSMGVKFGEVTEKLKISKGYYQMFNAALAWTAVKIFIYTTQPSQKFIELVDKYRTDNLINLLNSVSWPGRMEVLSKEPLIVLDGAHNNQAVETLAQTLIKDYGDKEQLIIFGHLRNHLIDEDLFKILPLAKLYPVNWEAHKPTAPGQFDWKPTLNKLLKEINPKKQMIVVTGSLYFVSQVREYLKGKVI